MCRVDVFFFFSPNLSEISNLAARYQDATRATHPNLRPAVSPLWCLDAEMWTCAVRINAKL